MKRIKNKHGWLKIVEAFVAVFIIMSVAIFVINKSYIEKRDITEKVYDVEVLLLQEIVDEFGYIKYNDPISPDERIIDDFIYGKENINKSRVPDYLECGIRLCDINQAGCKFVSREPQTNEDNQITENIYVQTLPIIETDSSLSIECWLK